MSDISIGDLVMVIKPTNCCSLDKRVGEMFIVKDILIKNLKCVNCGTKYEKTVHALSQDNFGFTFDRLKKIPPLSELDEIKTQEKITA